MKARVFILWFALAGLVSCNAQDNNSKKKELTAQNKEKQEAPKGNWKVNKEFDENGNMTRYDSIYTYGYSTENGDSLPFGNKGEMMAHFQRFFGSTQMPDEFMNRLFSDSLQPEENFNNKDFFSNRMFSEDIQEQLKQMDSIRNAFIKKYESQMWEDKKTNASPQKKSHV